VTSARRSAPNAIVLKLRARTGAPAPRRCQSRAATPTAARSPLSSHPPDTCSPPASSNTVTIDYTATTARYLRLNIHRQHRGPAGQVSEVFEVYGRSEGRPAAERAGEPGLHPARQRPDRVDLERVHRRRGASPDRRVRQQRAANDRHRHQLNDTQPASATVTYFVRAHDAAGNPVRQQQQRHPYRTGNGGTTSRSANRSRRLDHARTSSPPTRTTTA